jgi:hypothetical protein
MPDPGPGAGEPDVTIVIVSYNTRGLLARCVETAFAASPGISREVRVIDNASVDGSAEAVAREWPAVLLTVNRENRGYAPACNQGLSAARGRYVLALNPDALLQGDALGTLVRALAGRPAAAAAGPRLLNQDGSTQWVCARREPRFLRSLMEHTQLPGWFPALRPALEGAYGAERYGVAGEVEVLSGACLLFRRSALERVGLLDERLVLNYDDVEWSVRARRHGLRLHYEPAAEVVHLGGASRLFDAESSSVRSLDSVGAFWDLAYAPPVAAVLKLGLLASILLSLLKNLVLTPFVPGRRGRVAHLLRLVQRVATLLVRPAGRREAHAW